MFVPKLVIVGIWSFYWIYLANLIFNPSLVNLDRLSFLLGLMIIMAPFHIWVNNFYFFLVEQNKERGKTDFYKGFKEGFKKIPEAAAAFILSIMIGVAASIPGILVIFAGFKGGIWSLTVLGILLMVSATLIVSVMFYFTPVSVVVGEEKFFDSFKKGLNASRENRFEVSMLVMIAFILLLFANIFEGLLGVLGIIGFFIGRLFTGVIGVYVLLINPEMFLEIED
ncbi:MAG: hypothetical protein SVV03_02875 [Candidatus Nanohaloarchaea archaeon]|nr:hypothetical protein [Candidatus Nanohaloarchaea archaeon]